MRVLKQTFLFFLSFLFVFFTFTSFTAYANEDVKPFDTSNVVDDLKSATVNGDLFDFSLYPLDDSKDLQILNFVEFGYSYGAESDFYGLYIYLYNPKGLNIDFNSKQNKVQMAVDYSSDGAPVSYHKFSLIYCNCSDNNLFFKFRISDEIVSGKTFYDRVVPDSRRYDVSGFELLLDGDYNATEYGVGGTYVFSGYSEGLGKDPNDSSTLSCVVENLETLKLKVYNTCYRTESLSSLGDNHYNNVNSVYFSVPGRIFKEYGYLQKIRAEWWEYKTKMAMITSNADFYSLVSDYTGVVIDGYSSDVPFEVYSGFTTDASQSSFSFDWTYNVNFSAYYQACFSDNIATILPLVFLTGTQSHSTIFDYLFSTTTPGSVSSSVVADYIYNYRNDLGNGYLDCNGRKISKDLFESFVDDGRVMGYNNQLIDLEDTFDLKSYDSNHSWWDKLWDFGFSWPKTDGDVFDVAPIYEIKASDLVAEDSVVAENLLVNKNDVSDLKSFFNVESKKGNKVILFRFACTDYYSAKAFTSAGSNEVNCDTYVAQMTVFFDFDVLELHFNKDGEFTVIPAVSSPIDVINGFDPPAPECDWMKLIFAMFFLILLIFILDKFGILSLIFKAIVWLFKLIIKIIIWPFNLLFKNKKSSSKATKKRKR